MPREDGIASLEGDGNADSDIQCIGEFRIDRMLIVENKAHSLMRFEASSGKDLENMKLEQKKPENELQSKGNCSGQFAIQVRQFRMNSLILRFQSIEPLIRRFGSRGDSSSPDSEA